MLHENDVLFYVINREFSLIIKLFFNNETSVKI